jgi:chromate transporter
MPDQVVSEHRAPTASWVEVLVAFTRIGLTSFGGGSATVAAMRQLCLKKGWMDEQTFVHNLVLSRLTPGIGIIAQALLIGRKACGVSGMLAAFVGMMVPSLAITIALAIGYQRISRFAAAQSPLHAVAGIAAGYSVALAIQLFRDIMKPVPLVRATPFFLLFLGLGIWLGNPLIVMGAAITMALIVPSLFDLAPPPATEATDDDA